MITSFSSHNIVHPAKFSEPFARNIHFNYLPVQDCDTDKFIDNLENKLYQLFFTQTPPQ